MDAVNDFVTNALANPYVTATLSLFLAMYAGFARPNLPPMVAKLFDNAFFRLFVLFVVAYMSSKNITVAIMVAVAFTVTMNLLNEQKMFEGFQAMKENFEDYEE